MTLEATTTRRMDHLAQGEASRDLCLSVHFSGLRSGAAFAVDDGEGSENLYFVIVPSR